MASFTPPLNAGSGRNAYNFGKFLVEKGHKVTLLSLNRKRKLKYKEVDEGLKIIRLLYFNRSLLTKLISLFIILPGYFVQIARNQIVFIYGGNIIAFEFIIIASKLLGKKIVFRSTMYGEDDMETLVNRVCIKKFEKFTLNQVSLYFSINPSFTNSWEGVFGNRRKIFESVQGVDTRRFFPVGKNKKVELRHKLNLPDEIFIVVSVGYLIERKGFRNIFEALSKLDFPFIYLVIGDYHVSEDHYMKHFNMEMGELFQLGKNLLKDKLNFLGNKSNIDEYLKASDLFILNSVKEGFPNAVLESMACALPVLVRDIEGVDGFFTRRNKNILATSGESQSIQEGLNKLFYDDGMREIIGKEAGLIILEEASFEVLWTRIKTRINYKNG